MEQVERARLIATLAHDGQTDKNGEPYIDHCYRVAESVRGDDVRTLAWLHDVLEDTRLSMSELIALRVPADIRVALNVITRAHDESYEDYITRIIASDNTTEMVVKFADLRDNLRASGAATSLRPRYEKAIRRLAEALEIDSPV
jgi:(p)ppGpp synthase/HD superfamily hydrolase